MTLIIRCFWITNDCIHKTYLKLLLNKHFLNPLDIQLPYIQLAEMNFHLIQVVHLGSCLTKLCCWYRSCRTNILRQNLQKSFIFTLISILRNDGWLKFLHCFLFIYDLPACTTEDINNRYEIELIFGKQNVFVVWYITLIVVPSKENTTRSLMINKNISYIHTHIIINYIQKHSFRKIRTNTHIYIPLSNVAT